MVTRKNAAPAVKATAKPAAKPAPKAVAKPAPKKAITARANLGAYKREAAKKATPASVAGGIAALAQGLAGVAPAAPTPYLFALGQSVEIRASREEGIVRARGEFHHGPNQYLLAYTTALGAYATIWIDEDLLEA